MSRTAPFSLAAILFTCCTGLTGAAGAQTTPAASAAEQAYEPQTGQQGKDVVWVPTPQVVVDKMMELAKVTPQDVVIDLGSGDGRTVITAAKLGARALGIEYNPDMVAYSKRQAAAAGLTEERARFVKADLFETSFAEATVLTMFLLPEINRKLRPKILELKPGTRIVSNTFTMGEWQPDVEANLRGHGCSSAYCQVLHWVVPQQVGGSYKVAQGEVTLLQDFQMLTGTLKQGTTTFNLTGRVYGEEILLSVGDRQYRGRLTGGKLELRDV